MIESRAAGCDTLYEERRTGASQARPVLAKLIDKIRRGDALVVVRIDRLARSVSHLLAAIEELEDKKAHSRSLHDPMFSLQIPVPWRSSSGRLFPNGRRRGLKQRKPAVSFLQSRLP
jgi:DNA invertase Pin-like site-specific DNA recombinase